MLGDGHSVGDGRGHAYVQFCTLCDGLGDAQLRLCFSIINVIVVEIF